MEQKKIEELEEHFLAEDLRKMILYCMKKSTDKTKAKGQKFLNDKVRQRKNLYIYPEKVNV